MLGENRDERRTINQKFTVLSGGCVIGYVSIWMEYIDTRWGMVKEQFRYKKHVYGRLAEITWWRLCDDVCLFDVNIYQVWII